MMRKGRILKVTHRGQNKGWSQKCDVYDYLIVFKTGLSEVGSQYRKVDRLPQHRRCMYYWRFSAVVASFVVRTKLLNVEPGYWDGWPSSGGYTTLVCNQAN